MCVNGFKYHGNNINVVLKPSSLEHLFNLISSSVLRANHWAAQLKFTPVKLDSSKMSLGQHKVTPQGVNVTPLTSRHYSDLLCALSEIDLNKIKKTQKIPSRCLRTF